VCTSRAPDSHTPVSHSYLTTPLQVVCIITDSASVNKAAADRLRSTFPGITWVRCTTHAMNLVLKDIGKLAWVNEMCVESRKVRHLGREGG
jgi:hypothetical protein